MTKVNLFFRFHTVFCVVLLSAVSEWTFAQNVEISGYVLDEATNKPVIGANVFLTNEKTGAAVDADGKFTVVAASLPAAISVSYIGYKTVLLDVYESSEPIAVFLQDDVNYLNSVVVVGYGLQKRKELTGAISTISGRTLSQIASSFDQSLGGSVAGLNVTQSSGQPGATSSIRIRGGNSITGGNEPLYVIDGFILYNDNSSTRTGIGAINGGLNPLTGINSGDIESIEVLKDVSATAIYGSRGANGVIVITTKKGKRGATHIEYQGAAGWQQISKDIDLLNASEWISLYNDIHKDPYPFGETKEYDWRGAALRKAGTQNHQLSISGGDEKTRFFISGNYTRQNGIIRNTDFDKYAGRVNLERDLFKKLNVAVNFSISNAWQNTLTNLNNKYSNGSISDPFNYALRIPPVVPIYNEDGSYNYLQSSLNAEGDFHLGDKAVNPISDLLETTSQSKNVNALGNFVAAYTIVPSLVAKLNVGTNISNTVQNYYAPSTSAVGLLVNGYGAVGNKRSNSWQSEFTLNYSKQINKANYINILAGYTTQKAYIEYATATATDFANESLRYHNLAAGAGRIAPVSGSSESVLNSWLGRVNYSLLGRYNLTATFRADGSSRFAENHRWGYFPSLGLSWNINEEAFFNEESVVSALKLRVSAGTVGNQEIGDYKYEDTYGTRNYSFGGNLVTAYLRNNRINSDLKWETTTSYNAGLDFGLLKDKLNLSADIYYKETSDLLVEIPLEISSGFSSTLKNVGSVTNKGIELGLNVNIIDTKDFQWSFDANIARNINKITSLGGQPYFFPVFDVDVNGLRTLEGVDPLIVKVGEPLGTFYGYVFNGVIQTEEEAQTAPKPSWFSGDLQAGDPKFVNQNENEDNVINTSDKVVLGNAQPKFTYGFSTTLNYKGIDFSAIFQGSYGNQLYNAFQHTLEATSIYYNAAGTLRDRWTPTNPSNTVPRAIATPNLNLDSRYIEDASYLRLKNLTLGYTLPVKLARAPGFKVRLFGSAQNLLTLTKYRGYDPEASYYGGDETDGLYQGIDLGAYPSSKTFSFGATVSF
ncbi:MAG: TonB-dependent receptor [Dysgonamonadaceae bacterium]|jgi:TonB-linked SusC/RagA family outer membrane protein|nr:TonB-dependent receptor [Dysgonamonadaceae bacterium]